MNAGAVGKIDPQIEMDVRAFLYLEARLADRAEYSAWLGLWDDGPIKYWVTPREDLDPLAEVSLVYDDRPLLEQRVARWESGFAWAQVPRSLTSRLVGNVEILDVAGDSIHVAASVHVSVSRRGMATFIPQRVTYRLTRIAGALALQEKKVVLVDGETPVGNITFVL